MAIKRGDLVRWVADHDIYEASGDVLVGINPNYRHGIIIEVSVKDTPENRGMINKAIHLLEVN